MLWTNWLLKSMAFPCAAVALSGICFAQPDDAPDSMQLSSLKTPPAIDGRIDPSEWSGASQLEGFIHIFDDKCLDPRYGKTFIGYDKDNLYIAVSSELPPDGKLVANVKAMGGQTIHDDSIEIWIDPFRTERLKGDLKHPYCQFIGNSLDVYFEQQCVPGSVPNGGWRGAWNFKNGIDKEKGRWNAELSISWKSLGIPDGVAMDGREIGLLLSRNWKRPWSQSTLFRVKAFDNPLSYTALKLSPLAPAIGMDLGDIFKGKFAPEIVVKDNSGKSSECVVEAFAKHSDMPDKSYSSSQAIGPGESKGFVLKEDGDGFHPSAEHNVAFKVDFKGEGCVFKRTLSWKYPVAPPFPWKIAGVSQDSGVMLAYYPSFNKLRLQADMEAALGSQSADTLQVELLNAAGKRVKDAQLKMDSKLKELCLDLPDLDDGLYTVKLDFMSAGKSLKCVKKTFERQHFPWEGNKLGLTDKVYPPFIPMKASGSKLDVVLRSYELGKLGLPESILAKGNEVLSGDGMEFVCLDKSGELVEWNEMSGSFKNSSDSVAVYEGEAKSGLVNLKVSSRFEYDGCAKVELDLSEAKEGAELKEFRLDIPLKPEIAKLFHVCQASLRSNPAGSLPEGDGVIWDSTQSGHGPILGSFLPYVWIGREEEGLAWFADNDKGWILDDKLPCLKIVREKGRVVLEVLFVNKLAKIGPSRRIVFGWQASPTKPMPEDWRKPKTSIPMHGGSNRYWGIRPSYAGKYPDARDYSFADQLLIARKRQTVNHDFLKNWYDEHYGDVTDKALQDSVKAHIGAGMNGMAVGAGRNGSPLMLYFEEHCQDQTSPEWRTFQDEWGWKDFTPREWLKKIMSNDESCSGVAIDPSRSYQDFAMWEAFEWLRRGIGLYCDNSFLRQSANTFMTAAYLRDDGNVQISSGVWDMREYHKRMWTLAQECKQFTEYPLLISLHMTNTQLIPINTWDDVNLDIEWAWDGGNKPFPPDLLRAQAIGRQTGSYPHALHQVTAKNWYVTDKKDKNGAMLPDPDAVRHEWGIRMVHEILQNLWSVNAKEYPLEKLARGFGYGEPGCKVRNYWDKDYPVSISSDDVKSIAFERDGKLMLVLVSWQESPCEAKVKLSGDLKRYRKMPALDPESGAEFKKDDDGFILVPLKKYGVSLISFEERH